MGPPGELCQGRQRPSSMAMAPLFLLHHFSAVSFPLTSFAWLSLYGSRVLALCPPNCDCAAPAMVAAMPTMVGVAPLGGAVFSSVAT